QLRWSKYRFVTVRMRLTKLREVKVPAEPREGKSPDEPNTLQDIGQLFWRTTTLPESEATSVRFKVRIDGQWHEYLLPVHENRRWRGTITRLRLDPCTQPNVLVEVDSVKVLRQSESEGGNPSRW
ncbi:hypothetical protein GG496_001159, partial [Candidatus Fervidibacteria bacterium JGI MDM2 JNZ-1-D12]